MSIAAAQPNLSVVVKNNPEQAVPVKDLTSIATATAVNFTASFNLTANVFGAASSFYQVPANRRLVMQYVSMECDLPGSGEATGKIQSDQDHPGGTSFLGVFVPMKAMPFPAQGVGVNRAAGGTPVNLLFDAGRLIQLAVERNNGTGTGSCFVGFAGYLVPLP
jgi:hypothetical protein